MREVSSQKESWCLKINYSSYLNHKYDVREIYHKLVFQLN